MQYFKDHKNRIIIRGKVFPIDCSNFARAVYFAALNKDVFLEADEEDVAAPGNNSGVETIYNLFEAKYKIRKEPEVGDLIFFDNSYDKNRNKKMDDFFTHTAVVIELDEDGTVTFIHGGTGRGIAKDYMNLKHPHLHVKEGKMINSYLQRDYKWLKAAPKLTAELFHAFGGME